MAAIALAPAVALAALVMATWWLISPEGRKAQRNLGTFMEEKAEAWMKADEEAGKKEATTNATTDACSTCPPSKAEQEKEGESPPPAPAPTNTEKEEQAGKDAKRMSKSEADMAAINNGYESVHEMKKDYQMGAKDDLFKDTEGEIYRGPTRSQPGIPQKLGININGR